MTEPEPVIAALIVAAGRGTRARTDAGDPPKQFRRIGEEAVITHTVRRFLGHDRIGQVMIVIHADDNAALSAALGDLEGRVSVAIGGATRQLSVLAGLEALAAGAPEIVLIHDGVRPFLSDELISRSAAAAIRTGAALAAIPVTDTLKTADDEGIVTGTVPRQGLWAAQTPQSFRFDLILAAHRAARAAGRTDFTDDAAIAEWCGHPVALVEGERGNSKITTQEDLEMANHRLSAPACGETRIGTGFDVHAFGPGDGVTLGGVSIPHERGLAGHSDADVALHALTDALLGALAEGDIGTHFPPDDPRWQGARSEVFLSHAAGLAGKNGGRIVNLDLTIVCEAPRITPHRARMREEIARICGLPPARVSVKATTTEGLGATGRGEGIAAHAVASVFLPGDATERR